MNWLKTTARWVIDAGVTPDTPGSDARYVRFLNATLLLFGLGQVPILSLLVALGLEAQLQVNVAALGMCVLGFALNRRRHHLAAKVLIIAVMTINTVYFATVFGSSAPVYFWLIPGAVLGVLAFTPSEWAWATMLVGLSMVSFVVLEFMHPDMTPMVKYFKDPLDQLRSAQTSTVFAMLLTLVLVGMMHRRFAESEAALSLEKAKSDRLLRAILPDEIVRELRETGSTQAVRHEDVSLLFADIVGFTPLAASMPAENVVALLAEVFERFDELITHCGVEKIKTIGDAYMVAGGVPRATPEHAERLARCAIGMLELVKQFSVESGHPLQLRIGLHRGPAVAGVIGTTKFAYDLWGESVNLASRLESSGEPGRIHVSDEFRSGLNETMAFEERGEISLKGIGRTRTHWLIST
jgi:adenylate cyclase